MRSRGSAGGGEDGDFVALPGGGDDEEPEPAPRSRKRKAEEPGSSEFEPDDDEGEDEEIEEDEEEDEDGGRADEGETLFATPSCCIRCQPLPITR